MHCSVYLGQDGFGGVFYSWCRIKAHTTEVYRTPRLSPSPSSTEAHTNLHLHLHPYPPHTPHPWSASQSSDPQIAGSARCGGCGRGRPEDSTAPTKAGGALAPTSAQRHLTCWEHASPKAYLYVLASYASFCPVGAATGGLNAELESIPCRGRFGEILIDLASV